jgi:hypothetical protein
MAATTTSLADSKSWKNNKEGSTTTGVPVGSAGSGSVAMGDGVTGTSVGKGGVFGAGFAEAQEESRRERIGRSRSCLSMETPFPGRRWQVSIVIYYIGSPGLFNTFKVIV